MIRDQLPHNQLQFGDGQNKHLHSNPTHKGKVIGATRRNNVVYRVVKDGNWT